MACLEHATELDPDVRAAVEERARRLVPPRTDVDAEALAAVGPIVLELLPGPDGLTDEELNATVRTAWTIGGEAALPVLGRLAAQAPLPRSSYCRRFRRTSTRTSTQPRSSPRSWSTAGWWSRCPTKSWLP